MRHPTQLSVVSPFASPWANVRAHVSLHWYSVSKTALFAKHKQKEADSRNKNKNKKRETVAAYSIGADDFPHRQYSCL